MISHHKLVSKRVFDDMTMQNGLVVFACLKLCSLMCCGWPIVLALERANFKSQVWYSGGQTSVHVQSFPLMCCFIQLAHLLWQFVWPLQNAK